MAEASWVRSVYLYVMCGVSVALVLLGLATAAVGLAHTIEPDLGHRDTLDRVGIGLSNIGGEVVDLFNESQRGSIEEFCREVTDGNDEFEQCIDEQQTVGEEGLSSIQDGIAEVKDELRDQIRNNSIDTMIRGVLMVLAGLLLWRIHGPRTELFADGLMPKRPSPSPSSSPEPTPGPGPLDASTDAPPQDDTPPPPHA